MFVHGLWMLAGSWDPWRARFGERGYSTVAVDWPDDPPTATPRSPVPEAFAGKTVAQVADHVAEVIQGLQTRKPVVVGHSFGGLDGADRRRTRARRRRGRHRPGAVPRRAAAAVLVAKASFPVLGNPLNRSKAVMLTLEQFRTGSPTPSRRRRPSAL